MESPADRDDAAKIADAAALLGELAQRDVPLGALTTYRVGGAAALFVEAGSRQDLRAVRQARAQTGLPLLVVGKGSNLLVADAGFSGIAVVLGPAFEGVVIEGSRVRAGGAAYLPVVARRSVAASLRGLEWSVGVPGSVGGAVRMNAGGHGSDMAAVLERYRVVDLGEEPEHGGEIEEEFGVEHLEYGYRRSSLRPTQVVVEVLLRAVPGERSAGEAEIEEIVRWRREHQPGGRNAGSVFTNPPGDAAARLVEAAGLKGLRRGTAMVSEKHANFIQCEDGGSADDVLALIREVANTVERREGVRLATEIRLVGFAGTYPQVVPESAHLDGSAPDAGAPT
jgi:UDP-N-acetylmuramate dehydrogenase